MCRPPALLWQQGRFAQITGKEAENDINLPLLLYNCQKDPEIPDRVNWNSRPDSYSYFRRRMWREMLIPKNLIIWMNLTYAVFAADSGRKEHVFQIDCI